jgi:hypothetical protein
VWHDRNGHWLTILRLLRTPSKLGGARTKNEPVFAAPTVSSPKSDASSSEQYPNKRLGAPRRISRS